MPIYEFVCINGHKTEKLMPVIKEEEPTVKCPDCDEMAHLAISHTNFILKGQWFKNKGSY